MFNPCIEEGQAFTGHESSEAHDPARSRTRSFGHVDGDSNSGEDSDDSGKGALLDNETATSAAIQVWVTLFHGVIWLFFVPTSIVMCCSCHDC